MAMDVLGLIPNFMSIDELALMLHLGVLSGDLTEKDAAEEIKKSNLRYFLLEKKGNLEEIASALGTPTRDVQEKIGKFGLNLGHYQALTKPVPPYEIGAETFSPYVPENLNSLVLWELYAPNIKKQDLNELGWRRKCLKGMEIWEKGPTYTSMTARIVVDFNSDYHHMVSLELYGSDNKPIEGVGGIWDFMVYNGRFSAKAVRKRARIAFGIAEAYLSGATNVKDIRREFNKHKLEDISEAATEAVAQLRAYLSGGIISPREFDRSSELIRKYELNKNQVRFLREEYARLCGRDSKLADFQSFIEDAIGGSEFKVLRSQLYKIKIK